MDTEKNWLRNSGQNQRRSSAIMVVLLLGTGVLALFIFITNVTKFDGVGDLTLFQGGNGSPVDMVSSLVYPYYPDMVKSSLISDPVDGFHLHVTMSDPAGTNYLGVAIRGDFRPRESSILELEWRARGSYPGLEIHLLESTTSGQRGEVFTTLAGRIPETWITSTYPLSSFSFNMNHDPDSIGNKSLDLARILQLDIAVPAGADMALDIRSVRFIQDQRVLDRLVVAALVFLGAMFLIIVTLNRDLYPRRGTAPVSDAFTNRLAFVISSASILSAMAWRDYNPSLFPVLWFLGGIVILVILGDRLADPVRDSPLYQFRLLILFSTAVLFGLTWSQIGMIFFAMAVFVTYLDKPTIRQHLIITGMVLIVLLVGRYSESLAQKIPAFLMTLGSSAFMLFLGEILSSRSSSHQTRRILNLYEGIFHNSSEAIFTYGPDGTIETTNPGFERLVGGAWPGFTGRKIKDFVIESDWVLLDEPWPEGQVTRSLDLRFLHPDGSVRATLTRIHCIMEQGQVMAFQAIATDITERRRMEEELRKNNELLKGMAVKDSLTGVANRRFFDEQMAAEWQRALRQKSELALIVIDVDHFKHYNDTCGHQAGDESLKRIAACLGEQVRRSGELLCRYGGEEFAVILPHHGLKSAVALAERMREAVYDLAIPHGDRGFGDRVTISLGVACMDRSMIDAGQLFAAADKALYLAKAGGRNQTSSGIDRGALPI